MAVIVSYKACALLLPRTGSDSALLRCVVLFLDRLDQDLQRLHFSLWQEPKLGAKEHKMLEARVQVSGHIQCFERTKEAGVNDAIDTKQASEDLSTQGRELRGLEDSQGLSFIIVIWEFRFIVDLICDPPQNLFNIDRS